MESLEAGSRITVCRRILNDHHAEEIDGVLIDAQTANVMVKVWELFGPESRRQFETLNITRIAQFCWAQVT